MGFLQDVMAAPRVINRDIIQPVFGGGQQQQAPRPMPTNQQLTQGRALPTAQEPIPGQRASQPMLGPNVAQVHSLLTAPKPPTSNIIPASQDKLTNLLGGVVKPAVDAAKMVGNTANSAAQMVLKNPKGELNSANAAQNAERSTVKDIQGGVTQPLLEAVTSLAAKQKTVTPQGRLATDVFGKTPTQNVEKNVANNFNNAKGSMLKRVGSASLDAVGQGVKIGSVVAPAVKGAGELSDVLHGEPALSDATKTAASALKAKSTPLNEIGGVGKNVANTKLAVQKAQQYFADKPKATADYQAHTMQEFGTSKPNIVSADSAKFIVDGGAMKPENSAPYHEAASAFAKDYYQKLLDDPTTKDKPVLITGGGAGAGKTTGLSLLSKEGDPLDHYAAVNDTNLTTLKSATDRIDPALKSGRSVRIAYTYRHPVEAFTEGNLPRAEKTGRIVPIAQHVDTHVSSLKTIQQVAQKYKDNPNVEIKVIDNSRGNGGASIAANGVDFLKDKVYNKGKLGKEIQNELENAKSNGTVTPEAYNAYKEGLGSDASRQSQPQRSSGQVSKGRALKTNTRGLTAGIKGSSEFSDTLKKSVASKGSALSKPTALSRSKLETQSPTQLREQPKSIDSLSSTDNTTLEPKSQPRGFVQSVKNSDELSDDTKKTVSSSYAPTKNEDLVANSNELVGKGLDKATTGVLAKLSQASGRITAQDVSDSIAVAKAHDAAGNHDMAGQVLDRLSAHGTAAGQKVQALSLLSNRTPAGIHYSALKALKAAGVTPSDALTAKISAGMDEVKNTTEGSDERNLATQKLVKTVNDAIPRNKATAALGIWRAGLLTGPETLAKVGVSHLITAPIELASRGPSALVDRATSLVTGKRAFSASPADLANFAKGSVRGAKGMALKIRTGLDAPNTGGFETKFGSDTHVTPYEEGVMRAHGTLFKPNFAGSHDMSIAEQARTAGMNQTFPNAQAKSDFISNLVKNPTDQMKTIANNESEKFTNMNKSDLGAFANKVQDAKVGGVPVGKILVPFARIPSAIAGKGIVDWTPLGLGKAAAQVIKGVRSGDFDQRLFSQTVGRNLTGTASTAAVGYELMQHGRMTLAAPTDPKEKALWLAEGKQENSIRVTIPGVGDKWITLNALGPAGIAMGLGGAFSSAVKSGQDPVNATVTATAAAGKLVSDQPYFKGIAGAANALNDPQEYAKSFVDSLAGSSIPAGLSQAASGSDTRQRAYTPGVVDTLKSKIPGQRETLPVQRDLYGKALASGNGGSLLGDVGGTVDPFYPSTPRNVNDPVTKELQRLYTTQGSSGSPSIATPTSLTIEGHPAKATSANINTLESADGPIIHSSLSALIKNPAYQSLPDANKTNAVNSVLTQAKQSAEDENATKFQLSAPKKGAALSSPVKNLSTNGLGSPTPTTNKALTAQQLAIDKTAFSNSGKSYALTNGNVYQKDTAGNVTVTPKVTYEYDMGKATLTEQKDAGDVNGWLQTAQGQLNSIASQLKDPNTDPLQALTLENDASTLQTDMAKYKSYGGFTEGSSSSGTATTKSDFTAIKSALKAPKKLAIGKASKLGTKSGFKIPKAPKSSSSGGFKAVHLKKGVF